MDNLTVVTGCFRSGTSMAMQILEAGGFNPITHYEDPDSFNERGYYEIEETKVERVHSAICAGEYPPNSCVKVFVPFLDHNKNKIIHLADNVVFITRNVKEVIESINKKHGHRPYPRKILYAIRDAKKFLSDQGFRPIFLDYNDIIKDPEKGLKPLKKLFKNENSFLNATKIPEKRLYKTHVNITRNTVRL